MPSWSSRLWSQMMMDELRQSEERESSFIHIYLFLE